jgi:hypothetical protein
MTYGNVLPTFSGQADRNIIFRNCDIQLLSVFTNIRLINKQLIITCLINYS